MARASEAAYSEIKAWIQAATLPPGGMIDEGEAARRLSMSRTPVREALLRLQAEGLVEISRGKGIRVLPLSSADMREIYQVISGLEIVAVALLSCRRPSRADLAPLDDAIRAMKASHKAGDVDAWGHADERFHRELMRLSGNRKLYAVGCQMRDFAQRAHMVALRMQSDAYRATSTRTHADLVKSLTKESALDVQAKHLAQRLRGEDGLVGIVEKFNLTNL